MGKEERQAAQDKASIEASARAVAELSRQDAAKADKNDSGR